MTLEEYSEFALNSTDDEFKEWFKDSANNFINIGGIELPCYKLTDTKVVLQDRTVYMAEENQIREYKDKDHKLLVHDNAKIMSELYTLDVAERTTARYFLNLCLKKSRIIHDMESEINKAECEAERKRAKCSFCGKGFDEFPHMVAGPNGIYICKECADKVQGVFEEEDSEKIKDNK